MNDKESLEDIRIEYNKLAQEDIQESNIYFRELLKQSILISTIIISFLAFFFEKQLDASNLSCESVFGVLTIISLFMSIIFGMVQFLVDYNHSRKWSHFRYRFADKIADEEYKNYSEFYDDHQKTHRIDKMKIESNTWSLYLQLFFLALGLLYFIILIILIIIK